MSIADLLALLKEGSQLADDAIKAWTAHKAKLDAQYTAVAEHQKQIESQGPALPAVPMPKEG